MKIDLKVLKLKFLKLIEQIKALEKKQKILILIVILFLLTDLIFFSVYITRSHFSKVSVFFDNSSESAGKILGYNSKSYSGKIKKGSVCYLFTKNQLDALKKYYDLYGSVGINVRVGVKNQKGSLYDKYTAYPQYFTYGFLYDTDFDKRGKITENGERILSGCDLRNFIQKNKGWSFFSNELCLEKNLLEKQLPVGIIISSDYQIKIYDFIIAQAKIGYDYTGEIPFFGISSNGGSFSKTNNGFDFSGSSFVFPVENSRQTVMPKVEISFSDSEDYGDVKNQLRVRLNAGGDTISLRRTKDVTDCVLQTSTLISPFSSYDFTENGQLVTKLIMSENSKTLIPVEVNKVTVPLKTDPGLILSSKSSNWRCHDYEIYEWDRFPGVLFFDTIDYEVQADFFRRLAFFAEKVGFRGFILTDEQLGNMHGYHAHDYSAETLAAFFTKAMDMKNVLNERELLLRDILLQSGVIKAESYSYVPGSGAVISISRESTAALRQSFIAHEAWHGIFFINEDFRNAVAAVYYTVDNNTMAFMKGFWASQPGLGYDPSDEFLMHNEFMAYIMQQPLGNVAQYFVHCANRGTVIKAMPDLSRWVRENNGETFEDAAKIMNSYAYDNWGLSCGRVALVTR